MDNKVNKNTKDHYFSLRDRKLLEMDGIIEVITFNEDKVLLETSQGIMAIKGKDLNIKKLNLDDSSIKIEGFVSSLEYTDKAPKTGIFNRLFK